VSRESSVVSKDVSRGLADVSWNVSRESSDVS